MTIENATRSIGWSGLAAGALDLVGAVITNSSRGVTPLRILQSIASGWLGMKAYQGGYLAAALGLFSHFMIAMMAAAVYYILSQKLQFLIAHPYISGAVYGVAVYWFMQLVVLPLSNFPHRRGFGLQAVLTGMTVHILCVGLPIAIITMWLAIPMRFRRESESDL